MSNSAPLPQATSLPQTARLSAPLPQSAALRRQSQVSLILPARAVNANSVPAFFVNHQMTPLAKNAHVRSLGAPVADNGSSLPHRESAARANVQGDLRYPGVMISTMPLVRGRQIQSGMLGAVNYGTGTAPLASNAVPSNGSVGAGFGVGLGSITLATTNEGSAANHGRCLNVATGAHGNLAYMPVGGINLSSAYVVASQGNSASRGLRSTGNFSSVQSHGSQGLGAQVAQSAGECIIHVRSYLFSGCSGRICSKNVYNSFATAHNQFISGWGRSRKMAVQHHCL